MYGERLEEIRWGSISISKCERKQLWWREGRLERLMKAQQKPAHGWREGREKQEKMDAPV